MVGAQARECIAYDIVIVGGGVAGLSAAIRLKQLALENKFEINVCLIEKGTHIGAHIISGATIDAAPLTALFPDWHDRGMPLDTLVTEDKFYFLTRKKKICLPHFLFPPLMRNRGSYIVSLGNVSRWLSDEADKLGVEIYTGYAGVDLEYNADGIVCGVITGDFGISRSGNKKPNFVQGISIQGKYILVAEGAYGVLSEKLIARYGLRRNCDVQKYGLGIKETWEITPAKHKRGSAIHTIGWPLDNNTGGGMFLYHWGKNLCSIGMVIHLNYQNPYLSPYEEFQRAKLHPLFRTTLEGGRRIAYGARVLSEGGWQSVPRLTFPGGALIGDCAGLLNVPRIKGVHNAITSGTLAAETAFAAIKSGHALSELNAYQFLFGSSVVARDLKFVRNFKPLWSKFGTLLGVTLGAFDIWWQTLFEKSLFGTLSHKKNDSECLKPSRCFKPIIYPSKDNHISFDMSSSLYLANIIHDDNQPVHLRLADASLPLTKNLSIYDEPAQRYCPAGVYEIVKNGNDEHFQINASNCLHCKACEIKDPAQNISWIPPEGGSGPNYISM